MNESSSKIHRSLEKGIGPKKITGAVPQDDIQNWARELAGTILSFDNPETLTSCLTEAVGGLADQINSVEIAVTGIGWLGSGIPSVERTMEQLFAEAKREIMLTAYSLTSGFDRICRSLNRAASTGIRCVTVVNQLDEQRSEAAENLKNLAMNHPANFELHDFAVAEDSEGLHAKTCVVDRKSALVGSANLSRRGLVTAHEMAVLVRGPAAEQVADCIDRLLHYPSVSRIQPGAGL